jgi:hypothetical protein
VFRSRTPRSAVAAALSIVLIAAFMVGTTSAAVNQRASDRAAPAAPKPKPSPTPTPTPVPTPTPTPTPTPNSDNRSVYFGDPDTYLSDPDGNGVLVASDVTAGVGKLFAIDLFVKNLGNQRLTHAQVGYGSLAVSRPGSIPSLPAGITIRSATLNGDPCTVTPDDGSLMYLGALCDLGQVNAGEEATVQFIVNAPTEPTTIDTWASFKVAENVPDQGANRNTFFADTDPIVVGATNTNGNATFKLLNEDLTLTTANQTLVKKDSMTTTVSVPGVTGGAISISEEDCAPNTCTGQIATVHVRDGAAVGLLWTLVSVGQLDHPIVITHELDSGLLEFISESNPCDTETETNCMVDVDEQGNSTTTIFKTPTNGKVFH